MSIKNRLAKGILITGIIIILILGLLFLVLRTERKALTSQSRELASGKFIELKEGWVHYHLEGNPEGELVVLVHGFSVPDYVWETTFDSLVKAGYQVLSYDLYGRGYSDRPNINYDLDLFVTQLDSLLVGLALDQEMHLVGLSMGGPITAKYTNQHPDLVQSLTLIAPEVAVVKRGEIFPLNLPGLGEYLMATVMEPIVLPNLQEADFYHPERFPGWEERYRDQLQYHGTGSALLSTIRNLVNLDPGEEYSQVGGTDLPVLVIWGEKDQTITREQIQLLESYLPNLDLIEVPEAGHLPHLESPELVHQALVNFFMITDEER
jgi:pimeloyl-ACP methyl ester carboxylesterase